MIKKSIVLVGHEEFGKSTVLKGIKALFSNNENVHHFYIKDKVIWIRQMSNDDKNNGEINKFIDEQSTKKQEINVIIAFCPKLNDKKAKSILELLKEKSKEICFFVLKNNPNNNSIITTDEIYFIKTYIKNGNIEICESINKQERAIQLKDFIEKIII